MTDNKQAIYFMKDAVFAAADILKTGKTDGACDAALAALLKEWFSVQNEPVALLADGLAVPTLAHSETTQNDFSRQISDYEGPCFSVCSVCGRNAYDRSLRDYCITAAYIYEKEIKAAMVYDPSHAELYHAVKDLGAYMNGKSISVSRRKNMMDACISLDRSTLRTSNDGALRTLLAQIQDVRSGSAFSLELCHLASGRIDAVVGRGQSFIEYAAGLLIAKEAGASLLNIKGRPLPPMHELGERKSFSAISPGIEQEMSALLAAM